jgi:hypothetical protein
MPYAFIVVQESNKSGSCPISLINNSMLNESKVHSFYIFISPNKMTQHSNFPVGAMCDTASHWNASTLHNASHLAAHHKTAAASISSATTQAAGCTRVNLSIETLNLQQRCPPLAGKELDKLHECFYWNHKTASIPVSYTGMVIWSTAIVQTRFFGN